MMALPASLCDSLLALTDDGHAPISPNAVHLLVEHCTSVTESWGNSETVSLTRIQLLHEVTPTLCADRLTNHAGSPGLWSGLLT